MVKITEIAESVTFENAHELSNSTARPQSKHLSRKSSGNGAKKPRNPCGDSAWRKSKFAADEAKAALAVTEANRMILVVTAGKRRFVRLSGYREA